MDLNDLSAIDQVEHAFLIGLAALLADSVYNIGELVSLLLWQQLPHGVVVFTTEVFTTVYFSQQSENLHSQGYHNIRMRHEKINQMNP